MRYTCDLPMSVWALRSLDDAAAPGNMDRTLIHAALHEERRQRKHELTLLLAILPGVDDYLAEAKRRGLKLGVASSSNRGMGGRSSCAARLKALLLTV